MNYQELVDNYVIISLPWGSDYNRTSNLQNLANYIDWSDAVYREYFVEKWIEYSDKRFGSGRNVYGLGEVNKFNQKMKSTEDSLRRMKRELSIPIAHPRLERRFSSFEENGCYNGIIVKSEMDGIEFKIPGEKIEDTRYHSYLQRYYFTDQKGDQYFVYIRGIFGFCHRISLESEYLSFAEEYLIKGYPDPCDETNFKHLISIDYKDHEYVENTLIEKSEEILGLNQNFFFKGSIGYSFNDQIKKAWGDFDNTWNWQTQINQKANEIKRNIFDNYGITI